MEITTRDITDIKIVDIIGELNTDASIVAETILNKLRENGAKKILVNLEKLDFIASWGLRVLLVTAQGVKKDGGELRICGLNETVKQVFEFSGFNKLFTITESEANALSEF